MFLAECRFEIWFCIIYVLVRSDLAGRSLCADRWKKNAFRKNTGLQKTRCARESRSVNQCQVRSGFKPESIFLICVEVSGERGLVDGLLSCRILSSSPLGVPCILTLGVYRRSLQSSTVLLLPLSH